MVFSSCHFLPLTISSQAIPSWTIHCIITKCSDRAREKAAISAAKPMSNSSRIWSIFTTLRIGSASTATRSCQCSILSRWDRISMTVSWVLHRKVSSAARVSCALNSSTSYRISNFSHTGNPLSDDDSESVSREASPCSESPRPVSIGSESPNENICTNSNQINNNSNNSVPKVTHSTGTNTQNSNVNNKISNHVMNNSASGRSLHLQNKSVGVSYPIHGAVISSVFALAIVPCVVFHSPKSHRCGMWFFPSLPVSAWTWEKHCVHSTENRWEKRVRYYYPGCILLLLWSVIN